MRLPEDAFPRPGAEDLRWHAVVAVCCAYGAVAAVTLWSYAVRADVPVPYLAAGVYWGGLLLTGVREWRLIVPLIFAIQFSLDLWVYGAEPGTALVFSLSKSLEGLAGVAFLRFGPPLLARRFSNRCGRFVLVGGAAAPMLFALAPAAARETLASGDFFIHWLQWWLVQSSGIVLMAPFLLVLWLFVSRAPEPTRRLPEVSVLGLLALTLILLPIWAPAFRQPATLFMAMPLLFVFATRFGLLGAIIGNTLLGMASIVVIWLGVYDFPTLGSVSENVASLCVFLLANCGASLIIGASATDRENSVLAAERAQGQLSDLAVAAQEAEDAYRQQIAEMLHDDLGQNLALVRMRLDILLTRVDEDTAQAITEIRDTVDAAIASGRSITSGVAASIFPGGDLRDALQRLLFSFQEEMEITTQFKRSGKLQLDTRLASKLFRCSREIMLNVLKHANAGNLCVDIRDENGEVRIIIEDDGDGFDAGAQRSKRRGTHYGLSSCDNTLKSLGGALEISSSPGKGTKVIMTARSEG